MAVTVTVWHNPRCSKSRQTLALLSENDISPEIRLYLEDAPTEAEIRTVLSFLDIPAIELIRSGEKTFRELGLSKTAPEDVLIEAMARHPILIERPVVIARGRARIGRPPERALDII